jgi:uncharacterized surface protein with fasciclin (FAS1) repeats
MRMLKPVSVMLALATLAAARGSALLAAKPGREASVIRGVMDALSADRSLGMFTTALRSSGLTKMLDVGGSWTVFALSDRAFNNLPQGDLGVLMANPSAMHVLVGHYLVRGTVGRDEAASEPDVRTLLGTRLRIDVRGPTIYVNGAEWSDQGIQCADGAIYVLDRADLQFVHEAVNLAKTPK